MLGVRRLMLLDLPIVNVAFQSAVSLQAVAYNRAAQFDGLDNKTMQCGSVGIGDVPQPDATDALSIGLGRDDDQCFAHRSFPTTLDATPQIAADCQPASPASRANKALWPAQRKQIVPTLRFVAEALRRSSQP